MVLIESSPITKIFGEVRVPNASGRLFVVPISSTSLNYITKLEVLRATAIHARRSKELWSFFFQEITELLQPDIILVDSAKGFDEWAAFSLLGAADQAIVFLYPDEQNKRGIELLLEALGDTLSLQLVFSPVPLCDAGRERVRECWQALQRDLQEVEIRLDMAEPITVPYLTELALAQSYPVLPQLSNYTGIANIIDEAATTVRLKMPQATD